MSDINKLLKRAAVFEKLALYSNRTDYLKSLGQANPGEVNEFFQNAVQSTLAAIKSFNITNKKVTSITGETYFPIKISNITNRNELDTAISVLENRLGVEQNKLQDRKKSDTSVNTNEYVDAKAHLGTAKQFIAAILQVWQVPEEPANSEEKEVTYKDFPGLQSQVDPEYIINLYNQYKLQIQNALKNKRQDVLLQLKGPFKGVVNKLDNPYADVDPNTQSKLDQYVIDGNTLLKQVEQELKWNTSGGIR